MISIYIIITYPLDLSSFFSIYFIQNFGGFNVELVFIGAGIIIALAGYELLEGIFASGTFNGDDEEIFSPIALFSLLMFVAGLSYFG
tara:strand:- start:261 stop:521 length:261 start_codon:yes stop_codon:yes gene_type:complete